MFKQFTFKNIKLLAVQTERDSVHVVDMDGNNYGAWNDVESFLRYAKKDESFLVPIGKVRIGVISL